jgi:methionyl-tRNA formyltransferase
VSRAITIEEAGASRFALLGAGFHLCTMMEKLVAQGFPKPIVFTYPRKEHERDRVLLTDPRIYKPVFETAERLGVEVFDDELADAAIAERALAGRCTAAFSMSWRRVITQPLIDAFRDRVFNLHPSLLPKERGSGTFSYRIMDGSREVSATIHLVDAGLDTGDVLLQDRSELSAERPKPRDFLIATNALYERLIERFLEILGAGKSFIAQAQEQDENTYLPLLHTETNGAIDWSWKAEEIERFIRAFGDPYPGAFTFSKGTRLAITEAAIEPSDGDYHPYLAGRVLSVQSDGTVKVVARGGVLRICEVSVDGQRMRPAGILKATSCLHTPSEVLERARTTVLRASQMNVPTTKTAT